MQNLKKNDEWNNGPKPEKPAYYKNVRRSMEKCVSDIRTNIEYDKSTDNVIHGKTQSGKTEAMIYVMDNMIKICKDSGKKYKFLYLLCTPDNSLRRQSKERIMAGPRENKKQTDPRPTLAYDEDSSVLGKNVRVEHGRAFDKDGSLKQELIEFFRGGDVKAIFFDESHFGIRKDQNIHTFLKDIGLRPTDYPSQWDVDKDKSFHLFWVSATGYTRMLLDANDDPIDDDFSSNQTRFNHHYLQAGNDHVDANDMYKYGKIRNITSDQRSDYDWLYERYQKCKDNGQHMLIRMTGDDVDAFKSYLAKKDVTVDEYSSHVDNEIEELSKLKPYEKKSRVILVRGGLRMGISLPNRGKYKIGYAIDTHSRYADTVSQSFVGRMTGYPPKDNKLSKKDEWIKHIPEVYCNKNALVEHLKYERAIDSKEIIDPPLNSKMIQKPKIWRYKWEKAGNTINGPIPDDFNDPKNGIWTIRVSKNKNNDPIKSLLADQKPQGFVDGVDSNSQYDAYDGYHKYVHLDGPGPYPEHKVSWKKMKKETDWKKGDILAVKRTYKLTKTKEDRESQYVEEDE